MRFLAIVPEAFGGFGGGDFPKGAGPYGNDDLAGNVIAITGDIVQGTATETDGNDNSTVTVKNAPVVTWHRGGSWQGHQVTAVSPYHFISTNKYIAAGAKDNISPRARLEYYSGYYAADVFDPDGYSFEVVHKS